MKKNWTQPVLSLLSIDKTATGSQPGWIESCLASYENEEDQVSDGTGRRPQGAFTACRAVGNEYTIVADGSQPITPQASAVAS